jgi:hypothetical protein
MFSALALACLAGLSLPPAKASSPPPPALAGDYELRSTDYLSEIAWDKDPTQKLTVYLTNPKTGKLKTKVPGASTSPIATRDRQNFPESCGFRISYIEMEFKNNQYVPKTGAKITEAEDQSTTQNTKTGKFFVEHQGNIPVGPGMGGDVKYFLVQGDLQNVHHVDNKAAMPAAHGHHQVRQAHETKICQSVILKLTWRTDHWEGSFTSERN